MSYIDNLLSGDERVLVYGHQHSVVLTGQLIGRLISLALLVAIIFSVQPARLQWLPQRFPGLRLDEAVMLLQPLVPYVQIGCLILMVLAVVGALFDYLRWNARVYVLTSRRVINLSGVFSKRSIDSSLDKVNDVQLAQSWVGRMLNYGDLIILTASEQGHNSLDQIAGPLEFKRTMQEARQQRAPQRQPASAPEGGIERALNSLALLRDQNLLTPDEFEAKKQELLKRL